MSTQKPNYGCKKDTPDDNDYILVEALTKVSQELTILKQQELQFGLWNPKRARNGKPKNYQVDLRPVDPKMVSQVGDENIIIPLKPSVSLKAQLDEDFVIKFPKEYCLYKGYFDKALSFDALKQNFLKITGDFNCSDTDGKLQNFTVELWLKVAYVQNDINAEQQPISIIETCNSEDKKEYPLAIRYLTGSGRIICSRYNSDVLPNDQESQVISRSIINDGEFHHVAFIKDGENLYLYIDGEEEDNTKDTTEINKTNIPHIYIGSQQGKSNFFTGQMNEIRIWKTARTDEEIRDHFKDCLISKLFLRKKTSRIIEKLRLNNQDQKKINYLDKKINIFPNIENVNRELKHKTRDLICYLYFDKNDDFDNTYKEYHENKAILPDFNHKKLRTDLYYSYLTNHSISFNIEEKVKNTFELIDFDNWSEVKDQKGYPTCTVHAAVSILEYFERKVSGKYSREYSRAFLHYVAYRLHILKPQEEHLESESEKQLAGNEIPVTKALSKELSIREVMAAMISFGVPPEKHLPYPSDNTVTSVPDHFHYSLAQKYKAKSYFHLYDQRIKKNKYNVLDQIKIFICAGFPPIFGFRVYDECMVQAQEKKDGEIPFSAKIIKTILNPATEEIPEKRTYHAVVAVGYDDDLIIENTELLELTEDTDILKDKKINSILKILEREKNIPNLKPITSDLIDQEKIDKRKYLFLEENNNNGKKQFKIITKGAFKIRNSEGIGWGENGYGWLPYAYVLAELEKQELAELEKQEIESQQDIDIDTELTFDWWSMLKAEWFDTDYFGLSGYSRKPGDCDDGNCNG